MSRKKIKRVDKDLVVVGKLSVNAHGFGFVTPEDSNSDENTDIFIHANKMSSALHGDTVKVKIIQPKNYYERVILKKREGQIIQVLEHVNKNIIGIYHVTDLYHFVEADDARLPSFISIKNYKELPKLKDGMKVVVEIKNYSKQITGIITEILGNTKDVGVDILSIIKRYGITEDFSPEIMEIASKIEKNPSDLEIEKRIDRRKLKIVTIDGEDAKDLDDGVFARKYPDGSYFLGVYIADVSHYVKANSLLDVEAFERGTSIYPVDRVIPMLPKELSNGICSLNAGVDRLAMACEMQLTPAGKVKHHEIFKTVIHVHKRLTYTAVNKFFDNQDENVQDLNDIAPMLNDLKKICELRNNIRIERGSIDFDIPEIKVILNKKGKPVDIVKRERNLAESIIEECMLVANETVAKHMYDLHKPFIYRIHEQPNSEKIDKFNRLLANFGFHLNKKSDNSIRPADIQKILDKIKGTRAEKIISTVALRSMQQARYTATQSEHFGLAADYYTHFTSPIRRYPDLIVHRLLTDTLEKTKENRKNLDVLLDKIAKQSSDRERRAIDIERETVDLKSVEYMQKFVGKFFNGVIVSVTKFGFFVELDNGVDGLVRIASISGDYFNFVEEEFAIVGRSTGKTFKIGDEVRVKLIEANIQLRQLTFTLVNKIIEPENLIVD